MTLEGNNALPETEPGGSSVQQDEWNAGENTPHATAKDIPPPPTSLAVRLKEDAKKMRITLLVDPESVPSLEEVTKINGSTKGAARTPLMTVIHAVLAKNGGSMTIADLVTGVLKHWNRPFPGSPYSPEEFIFVMATSSDDLRAESGM